MYKRLRFKAILAGFLIEVAATFLIEMVLVVIWTPQEDSKKPADEIMRLIYSNGSHMTTILVIGSLLSVMGGFIAGKVAKGNEQLNAGAAGVLASVISIALYGSTPLGYWVLGLLLTWPSYIMGGKVACRSNQR